MVFSGLVTQENSGKILEILWDREVNITEHPRQEISHFWEGNIRFPGNGIRECTPLQKNQAYTSVVVVLVLFIVILSMNTSIGVLWVSPSSVSDSGSSWDPV